MSLPTNVSDMLQLRTAGYRPPMAYRPTFSQSGLPPFTLTTVEWMRRDPQIQLGMAIKAAPFHKVKLTIKGDPIVTQFMADQMRRFWHRAIPKVMNAFWYTISGGEISYKVNEHTGKYEFWQYTDIYPTDLTILSQNNIPVGINVKPNALDSASAGLGVDPTFGPNQHVRPLNGGNPIPLLFPKGFLYIHRREFNSLIGRSEFEASYETWLEKTDYQGAKHSRKLWFYKNAFGGGFLFHPEGSFRSEDGTMIPYRDLARQAMETAMNGAIWCLENKRDPTTGEKLWEYVAPSINGGGSELLEYITHLDNEMLRGLGIPDDVVQQVSGTGSYAGRTIPLTAFLISHESLLDNLFNVCDEQVFRPLCKANFGHDNYEATMDVDIDAILGTMNPDGANPTDTPEEASQDANGITVPSQMSDLSPTCTYYGQNYRDPFNPHVRCTLLGANNKVLLYLPDDTVIQMSGTQHLEAGLSHLNKSGKTSKGGQFVDTSEVRFPSPQKDVKGTIHTLKIGKSTVVLQNEDSDSYTLCSVRVPTKERGKGEAKTAVNKVVEWADANNVELKLIASPLDKKTRLDKLVKFYQSKGFSLQENGKGGFIRGNPAGDPVMVRKPSITQMSGVQHLGAGQTHNNKSGKTSKGGQFTDGAGNPSTKKAKDKKAAKPPAANNKTAKGDLDPEQQAAVKAFLSAEWKRTFGKKSKRVEAARKASKAGKVRAVVQAQEPKSDVAKRAKENHVMISAKEQQYADTVERNHAKIMGGVSFKNNEAVDIVISDKDGAISDVIEWKTMVVKTGTGRDRIDMNSYAQARKIVMEKRNSCISHTIICDDREVYESGDESKRVYYYRRGVAGSARLTALHRCDTIKELRTLMKTPEKKLPKGAQRSDSRWHEGTWKETNHPTDGRNGYMNNKTKEVVYAKKS